MCSDLKLQVNGFCPDMTINEQLVSLLYAYGADTVTNIMSTEAYRVQVSLTS